MYSGHACSCILWHTSTVFRFLCPSILVRILALRFLAFSARQLLSSWYDELYFILRNILLSRSSDFIFKLVCHRTASELHTWCRPSPEAEAGGHPITKAVSADHGPRYVYKSSASIWSFAGNNKKEQIIGSTTDNSAQWVSWQHASKTTTPLSTGSSSRNGISCESWG